MSSQSNSVRIAIATLVGLCLFSLYFIFLGIDGAPILLAPMGAVESLIFYTLALRVLAVTFVPYLRKAHAQVKIALFSIETFVLVLLIFDFVITRQLAANILIGQVLTSWLGATSILLTPYLIWQISLNIYKGMSSSALVLSVTPEYVVGVFLVAFAIATSPPSGISAFGASLVGSIRAQQTVQGVQMLGSNPLIVSISVIIFLCMLFQIGLMQGPQGTVNVGEPLSKGAPRYPYQMLLLLAGAVFVFFWLIFFPSALGTDALFTLCVPAIAITAILWGLTKRRDNSWGN
jgi:hypothetical protein